MLSRVLSACGDFIDSVADRLRRKQKQRQLQRIEGYNEAWCWLSSVWSKVAEVDSLLRKGNFDYFDSEPWKNAVKERLTKLFSLMENEAEGKVRPFPETRERLRGQIEKLEKAFSLSNEADMRDEVHGLALMLGVLTSLGEDLSNVERKRAA